MTNTKVKVREVKLYIDGEYVESSNGSTFEVKNPATQEVIAQVHEATKEDVDRACRAARRAFEEGPWRTMSPAERSSKIRRMAEIIIERKEELARLEALDVGKPYPVALEKEIPRAAHNLKFFADFMEQQGGEVYPMGEEYLNYTRYEPVGVAALITPWNLPFMLTTWKLGPCLATGNTAVIKPAEVTPLTVSLLGEIAKEAGIPDGVVNVVQGFGPNSAGEFMTTHPEVDLISFTGETSTGKAIMKNGADSLKKVSFELGGKAANIIFEDANLDKAVPTSIQAAFMNSGQVCLAGSRILVQRSIFSEFVERFKKAASELKVGDPQDTQTNMGPVVSEEHYQKVTSYLGIAEEEDSELVYGGKRPDLPEYLNKGYYLEPTIFIQENPQARICQEEIFGPVVTLIPFDMEEEALEIANSTEYGLNGVIWTDNLQRAHRVSHDVRAGTIWVNCWFVRDLRAPFGGFKKSGIGREGGHHSLEFFSEAKNICIALK
ncbi:aldehyde dehydrogenase [Bacillus thermotolerans]|uniref:5-carboxymethyl-2-hydroxymuconate semialdehyde dehydrogenase n=1 Tax=Bacillus thermotolerans TaxID=1221996 RepID=A0A0F5HU70_BACTR|nr:aldehyde dehydrogenase [Bacillus thermotolerans]KKB36934.1 5-carboxymethyl-2-hydroxymuconate semialdehyde dehydrogenase [Bacillus thermotolerans]KKB39583.1 5-carboxymethyl-2-hydroxymuconate semialdehyde dehydrogenase [Bacillus thermotolerans]